MPNFFGVAKVGEHFYRNGRMWLVCGHFEVAAMLSAVTPEVEGGKRPVLFEYGETDAPYTLVAKLPGIEAGFFRHWTAPTVERAVLRLEHEHPGAILIALYHGWQTPLEWSGPYGSSPGMNKGGNRNGEAEAGQRVGEGPASGAEQTAAKARDGTDL